MTRINYLSVGVPPALQVVCVCVYMWVSTCVLPCLLLYVRVHVCVHVCVHACVHASVCACACACVCIHVHTHAYAHMLFVCLHVLQCTLWSLPIKHVNKHASIYPQTCPHSWVNLKRTALPLHYPHKPAYFIPKSNPQCWLFPYHCWPWREFNCFSPVINCNWSHLGINQVNALVQTHWVLP